MGVVKINCKRYSNTICFYNSNSNKLLSQFVSLHVNKCPILVIVLIIGVLTVGNFDYSYGQADRINVTDIKAANILINPVTNKSYFIAPDENKVYVVNETTNSIIKPLSLRSLSSDGDGGINPETGLLYIGYDSRHEVGLHVINGTNDEKIDTIPINWIHEFKVNSFDNKLYYLELEFELDNSFYTLKELDLSTRNISREIEIPIDAAYSMEIIPSKQLVLIGNANDGQVLIINASSSLDDLEIIDSVRVANTPSDMIASPLNNKVYVINGVGNRIS